ncbi:MAG: tRNA (adenosine(37)-N6)-dimethylallyltransferase MiaA [Gammaproteobacteria bacterium]
MTTPLAIGVTGPTAAGKTEAALAIAAQVPVEIISVDSALVYRGMDIGTAKPTAAERAAVPHHLIDILDPAEPYSAGRFLLDARRIVAQIMDRGRVPLFVGGTMLYLRVLSEGIGQLPNADPEVRAWLDAEAESLGWPALHARLASLDPAAAQRIGQRDSQRIQRALEVYYITGETLSHQQRQPSEPGLDLPLKILALWPQERVALGAKIEARFDAMVAAGFLGEVEALFKRDDLTAATPAMRCVGYRQLWAHLAGEMGWDEARQAAIVATRQLAKRQVTWLRRMAPDCHLDSLAMPGGVTVSEMAIKWAQSLLP